MTIKQIGGIFGRNPEFNDVEVTGELDLPDGVVASFGDNKDFQIVHDGSHTYLTDGGDGNVYFRTNSQFNLTASNGAVGLQFNPGVNVLLRHNNVPVFTTTSNGAAVYGNLTMATAGGGIDFSATAGTGTSELFDDYEEGTWTPVIASSVGTITTYAVYSARYTKVGRVVVLSCHFAVTDNGTGSGAINISGFPFTNSATAVPGVIYNQSSGKLGSVSVAGSAASGTIRYYDATYPVATGQTIQFSLTYSE